MPPLRTAAAAPGLPGPPRPLRASARSVEVEWDPPDSDVPLLEYEVWSGPAEASPPAQPRAGRRSRTLRTAFRVTGLAQNTLYQFRVRARNSSGWSSWSACSEAWSTSDACSQDDFKAAVVRKHGGTLTSAWRAFDRDGDGAVSREEFCAAFDKAGLGAAVPLEHRLRLFAEADERGCGRLSYRDFAQSFSPYKATPALARHLMPEVPEAQRQEVLEEICGGNSCGGALMRRSRAERVVERLTAPRDGGRLRRTRSEGPCPATAASCCGGSSTVGSGATVDLFFRNEARRQVSEHFPYRPKHRGRANSVGTSVSRCSSLESEVGSELGSPWLPRPAAPVVQQPLPIPATPAAAARCPTAQLQTPQGGPVRGRRSLQPQRLGRKTVMHV